RRDEDLLKDLLADDYCHVCEAVLLFESQRLSHYQGKKHAQRVRVYLQTKKAGKRKRAAAWAQQWRPDEDHVCRLCNMVFSSHMVATSHYEGKVHAKNMRKVVDRRPGTWPVGEPVSTSAQDLPLDQQVSASSPNAEEDPKDPNRRCSLCAATFNNPRMALQHYNGRKHQRNLSRRELLKGLEDQLRSAFLPPTADCLMCQICDVQLNSVEMFQAHMQGSKHLSSLLSR
uniref:Matrin-type domain-containing protein n=1 Tax=Tetraodon nigroviridis TaxID=99883 RepID=H3CAQ5_TETNG